MKNYAYVVKEISKKQRIFAIYKDELLLYGSLRNVIQHNNKRGDGKAIAEPHAEIVDRFRMIKNTIINPPKITDIAIHINNIFSANINDKAIDVMKKMNEYTYTHVPILEDGRVKGMFSENTIFLHMTNNGISIIENDTTLDDFKEFLPINKHITETFLFVSRRTLIIKAEELFEEEFRKGNRLAALFITENGDTSEKLLGMVTIWDLLGKSN